VFGFGAILALAGRGVHLETVRPLGMHRSLAGILAEAPHARTSHFRRGRNLHQEINGAATRIRERLKP